MSETLAAVAPIFAIVALGWAMGRFGIFSEGASAVLARFVFVVALPALIFTAVSRLEPSNWPSSGFFIALGGGMAVLFPVVLSWLRRSRPGAEAAVDALIAMFSSTAYLGLPLVITLYGEAALPAGVGGTVLTGAVFLPIGVFCISAAKAGGAAASMAALKALANPIVAATALAFALFALEITPPAPAMRMLESLGGAFTPTALFAAGLFCARRTSGMQVRLLGGLVFAKLLILPAITWVIADMIGLTGLERTIAILFAGLPTGVPVFIAAVGSGVGADRAAAAILWSTIVSLATLPVLIQLAA